MVNAWRDIRSLVKPDHPSIEALLNSCKPLDVRGNKLYLGFQSNKVRELFDIPERIAVARKAIAEVLGVDLSIICVITNAKGNLPPDVNPNGMVATAIQNGGEIVDVQRLISRRAECVKRTKLKREMTYRSILWQKDSTVLPAGVKDKAA